MGEIILAVPEMSSRTLLCDMCKIVCLVEDDDGSIQLMRKIGIGIANEPGNRMGPPHCPEIRGLRAPLLLQKLALSAVIRHGTGMNAGIVCLSMQGKCLRERLFKLVD